MVDGERPEVDSRDEGKHAGMNDLSLGDGLTVFVGTHESDFLSRGMGVFSSLTISGSATAAVKAAHEQSFDPHADQCSDQVRSHARANNSRDNDDRFVDGGADTRRDFRLEVEHEQRSGGGDRLADEDADEQADDDAGRTSTERARTALDVLAAQRAAGVRETAEEARHAADAEHDGVAAPDAAAAAAAAAVRGVGAAPSARLDAAHVRVVTALRHLYSARITGPIYKKISYDLSQE